MAKEIGLLSWAIMAFILLILGTVFLTSIANETNSLTEIQTITNESFAGILNQNVSLGQTDLTAVSAIRNTTATVAASNYTVNLSQGTILLHSVQVNGTFFADYTYFTTDFISDNPSRTLLRLVALFFAISILILIVMITLPQIKDILGF